MSKIVVKFKIKLKIYNSQNRKKEFISFPRQKLLLEVNSPVGALR